MRTVRGLLFCNSETENLHKIRKHYCDFKIWGVKKHSNYIKMVSDKKKQDLSQKMMVI